MAWLFKKTILRGDPPLLIMELPPYKRPLARVLGRHMWDRSKVFLKQAGTVILGVNIILWFLATYPRDAQVTSHFEQRRAHAAEAGLAKADLQQKLEALEHEEAGMRLKNSFAGRLGHLIEPAIAPLGFDWKIGIGIVSSFAAREVFVSTMSTVYNVSAGDSTPAPEPAVADPSSPTRMNNSESNSLVQTLRAQRRPDGTPMYTALTGLTLLVFYVFALQCVSTIAIVKRETNSWRWPLFQWAYLAALAWLASFATLQIGRLLGIS